MRRFVRQALRIAGLVTLVVGGSAPASAVLLAAVCNDLGCTGGDDIIVTDNGAGDTVGVLGAVNFSTSAYGFSLAINTSQSKPVIGSAGSPQLDLNFTATTSDVGSRTIFMYVSDTGFSTGGSSLLSLGGTNSGGSGTVIGRAWGGTSNTALSFSPANLFGTVGPESGAAFSDSSTSPFTPSVNLYSLTLGVAITRSTPGTSTGDLNLQISAIPEPSTWAMMLVGCGAIGGALRRHRRTAVTTVRFA